MNKADKLKLAPVKSHAQPTTTMGLVNDSCLTNQVFKIVTLNTEGLEYNHQTRESVIKKIEDAGGKVELLDQLPAIFFACVPEKILRMPLN